MSVTNALTNPKPYHQIPILFGGSGERALKRIAAKGDGWIPSGLTAPQLAAGWDHVGELAEKNGRDPRSLRLLLLAVVQLADIALGTDRMPFQGTVAQVIEDLAATAGVGAHETILSLEYTTSGPSELLDRAAEIFQGAREAGLVA